MVDAGFKLTCIDPVFYKVDETGRPTIMYPCGKCIVCKEKKRRQWAIRMENEKTFSKSCYFVTLTYADEYLYRIEPHLPASLNKSHYVNFLKRLRKSLPYKIRFFGVGEYGSDSSRPHYHFMFFLPEYVKRDTFRSYIYKAWTYGFNTVKDGLTQRMYYIAKYTVKGSDHPFCTESPFQTCSCSPPIGFRSFQSNLRILDSDVTHNFIVSPSSRKSSIPRSFENKYKKYLDERPRTDTNIPSLVRKHVLQKQASYRLRDYLKQFNDIPPDEFLRMRETIERRYNSKHKHKINKL